MKQAWNAGQIGMSSGAYSGRTVKFMQGREVVEGVLTRSDWPTGTSTLLIVGSRQWSVPNETLVEVS